MLCFTVAARRNDRLHILRAQLVADLVTIVPFVHHPMSQVMLARQLLEDGLKQRGIVTGARGDYDRDPGPLVETPEVNLSGKASSRTAQSLGCLAPVFFNAPAACWWARTMVLSINSCRAPVNLSSCNPAHNRRHTPLCSQRRNRLYTASQCPNSFGKSRQGTPVRARYKTASRNMRSLCSGGRSSFRFTCANTSAMSAQVSSVKTSRTSPMGHLHVETRDREVHMSTTAHSSSTRPKHLVANRSGGAAESRRAAVCREIPPAKGSLQKPWPGPPHVNSVRETFPSHS